MADNVTNLRQFRKQIERAKKRAQADENAAKFGASKGERILNVTRNEKAAKFLDAHFTGQEDEE